jgi:hypothetical protein
MPRQNRRFRGAILALCGLSLLACNLQEEPLVDADGDGFVWVGAGGDDCDDTNPASHPGAQERCDALDNDCDGEVDEGVLLLAYPDRDGDGFGAEEGLREVCYPLPDHSEIAGDCDDTDPEIHPDAEEICDLADNDCDGEVDEGGAVGAPTWFPDGDGDGFGDSAGAFEACRRPPAASDRGGDCDDSDPAIYPGAPEACHPIDMNCDGSLGTDDQDGDGLAGCSDCDDGDPGIYPGALEVCDARDQNCDGVADEAFDLDGDGVATCGPDGQAGTADDDCDDTDSASWPQAPEIPYDGVDQDCDGADLVDVDGDGHAGIPAGGDDCDDREPSVHPGFGIDVLDGLDNDCDGPIDEGPFSFFLSSDIQPVWTASCATAGCHTGATPSANLHLGPGNSAAQTIDVPAGGAVSYMDRLEPLDPLNSYLWHKIENTHLSVGGGGLSMPRNRPLLPQGTRDMIRTWIEEGCPP